MESFLYYLVCFLGGVVAGAGSTWLYIRVMAHRIINRLKAAQKDYDAKNGRAQKRLAEARKLAKQQNTVLTQLEVLMKSEDKSDGAVKAESDELLDEWEALERQKLTVLRKVLDEDKIDPMVSVVDPYTGNSEEIKLSRYIASMESGSTAEKTLSPQKTSTDLTDSLGKTNKSCFIIKKGSKYDC